VKIGIIIPVKYYRVRDPRGGQDPRESDIDENAKFAKINGFVYWDLNILEGLCNPESRNRIGIEFPTCCYFYNSQVHEVTHKAELVDAYRLNELKARVEERKFVPEWRMQCLEGQWSKEKNSWVKNERPDLDGRIHEAREVWIKLRNFEKLSQPKKISDFTKKDGSKLEGRRGAYIMCP